MIKNVLEWLEIRQDEKAIAYQDDNESITFEALNEYSKKIGSALKDIKGNNPVAIIGGRSIYTIVAYLGVVYSGHAYAPIDGTMPKDRINCIIETLKPSALITDRDNYQLAKELCEVVFLIDDMIQNEIDEKYLAMVRSQMLITDPLYVIFTSGSMGRPKGVITSHQSLMCYIESYVSVMQINEDDILGNQSPLDYIAAIRDIYIPLFCGCKTFIISKSNFSQPDRLFDCINEQQVTVVGWSTAVLELPVTFKTFEEKKLCYLKKVCFSGSIMKAHVLREWQMNLPDCLFVNQYGPTEATASCTYYIIDHLVDDDETLLIGRPYNNYRVFLLNDNLSPTPHGEIGEICVSGPILALGYYNDRERTEASFVDNPNSTNYPEKMYRTGDYGRINEDGMLEFHGRMDRQIKLMGHRVELDEIDCVADRVDGVEECVAVYNSEKERIHLFYAGSAEKRQLAISLREYLPEHMIPRKFEKMEKLPRLANGKINIQLLKECL